MRVCVCVCVKERERMSARALARTCKMLHYLVHSVTTVLQTVEFTLMCGDFPWTI